MTDAPWGAEQFTYGDTAFRIRKLLPMPAWHAFEKIRPHIGAALGALDGRRVLSQLAEAPDTLTEAGANLDAMMPVVQALGDVLGKLPPEVVDSLRETLFQRISFTNQAAPKPQVLGGVMIDTAFAALTPAHIYMVLIRAVIVNFAASFSAVASLFPAAAEDDTSPPDTAI